MSKKSKKPFVSKSENAYNRLMFSDGFVNFLSRVGIGADNMLSTSQYAFTNITRNNIKLEAMYRSSWVVGAVVDIIADDMTRSGISFISKIPPEETQQLQNELSKKAVWESINELIKWGRLYGGALAYIDIAGQDPATPLKIDRIGKGQFRGLTVFDRWAITPDLNRVIAYGAQAGNPEYYDLYYNYFNSTLNAMTVHHSRVIRLIGNDLPIRQKITEEMWGQSVIERMYDRLLSYDSATMSTANLVDRASVRVAKVENLREVLAQGEKAQQNLLAYFYFMRLLQSNQGISLLDKADDFQAFAYNFSGLSDVLLSFGQQLAGATGIPLMRLYGQGAAGLNSNDESVLRMYYDNILALQQRRLKTPMHKVLRVVYQSEFGKTAPDDFDYKFIPLWQTTQKEKAENSSLISNQIALMYESGIISLEVALKELKQSSEETGIFTNITDEDIEEAKFDPPPSAVEPESGEASLKPKTAKMPDPIPQGIKGLTSA